MDDNAISRAIRRNHAEVKQLMASIWADPSRVRIDTYAFIPDEVFPHVLEAVKAAVEVHINVVCLLVPQKEEIHQAMLSNENLRSLCIVNASADDCRSATKILFHNKQLKKLRILGGNYPTPALALLFKTLAEHKGLETLALRSCYLGCYDIKAIADALSKNTTLKELDLTGNTTALFLPLAKALKTNKTLRRIDLSYWLVPEFLGCLAGNATLAEIGAEDFETVEAAVTAYNVKRRQTNRPVREQFLKGFHDKESDLYRVIPDMYVIKRILNMTDPTPLVLVDTQ